MPQIFGEDEFEGFLFVLFLVLVNVLIAVWQF